MRLPAYTLLFISFFATALSAQSTVTLDSTILVERVIAMGLDVPWEVTWGPDDNIWFTEKPGRVKRIDMTTGIVTEVLDIRSLVDADAEPGLLGMAIHPDFETNPHVFLAYTYYSNGNAGERLARYTWNGSILTDGITLLEGIKAAGIHNGARLLITPDGKLLMTTGDVGSGDNSQNLNNLNGKLLRINLDGSIPDDNPVAGSYIYTFGHRNSQGLAYGPNGILYESEHGAQSADEFNIIEPNRNYGWPNVQGVCNTNSEINFCQANDVREPLKEWTPCVAVNDLAYYNHEAIPEWKGKMLLAVLGGFVQLPRLSVLTLSEDGLTILDEKQYFDNYGRIRDVCVNPHTGSIYFATNGNFYPSSGPNRIIEYYPMVSSSVDEPKIANSSLKVYPNPTGQDSAITLEVAPLFLDGKFEFYTFDGNKILEGIVSETTSTLRLENTPAGNYYVKVSKGKAFVTQVVIVQ